MSTAKWQNIAGSKKFFSQEGFSEGFKKATKTTDRKKCATDFGQHELNTI